MNKDKNENINENINENKNENKNKNEIENKDEDENKNIFFYSFTAGTKDIDTKEFLAHFTKLQKAHTTLRNDAILENKRINEEKQKNAIEEKQNNKLKDLQEKLHYTTEHENSFLEKIRIAAQNFCVDAGLYADNLSIFKNTPSLHITQFKTLIEKSFQSKFSYPELGVLLR